MNEVRSWNRIAALGAVGMLALSSACSLLEQARTTPEATAPVPPPAATGTQAGCPADALVAPDVAAQASPVISDDLRPTLEWWYAGECPPDGFRIEVAPNEDFSSPAILAGTAAGDEGSWSPSEDLRPASRYAWRVAAVSAGVIGPFSVARSFWTGPVCGGVDLQPPTLLTPNDGAYVEDPSPLLDFEYPESVCLQELFSIDVSPDPDFATDALHATLGPDTEYETTVDFLADCTLYYWRAKAVFGEDISGPYSAVSAFYADFTGACAPHTGLPRLSGIVWQDVCVPGDGGTPPSCVWQEGGLAPDGVRQDGEAALPGLLVRVAPGVCTLPDMGWTTGPTDAEGRYSQVVLPGTYCAGIFRDQDGNQSVLGSGRWTHPPGGYDSPVRYEVAIDWGEERPDLDFAWWRR